MIIIIFNAYKQNVSHINFYIPLTNTKKCYKIKSRYTKELFVMNANPRRLFNSDFASFLYRDINSVFGALCDN